MKHLFDIKELNQPQIEDLFEQARIFSHTPTITTRQMHQGRSAMALFFENSTRTLTSFQLACQRLGVDVTALNIAHSSTQKGETLRDTLLTLDAMQTDVFVVRHSQNHIQKEMAQWLNNQTSIINAGDGTNQHPTQGLLDLYTIWQNSKDFSKLKVAIIGDIKHSRVANSLIDGLNIMGCRGLTLFGPDTLIPTNRIDYKVNSMSEALDEADVVVMLRIQKERLPEELDLDINQWHQEFGLNQNNLKSAKPNAIVMHPGPMNRGIEISTEVADGSQSKILEQVKNGVLIRQALIHKILSK